MTTKDRLASALLCLWAGVTIYLYWNSLPEDLSAIYVAGWLWDHGSSGLIYAAPDGFFGDQAESWDAVTNTIGGPEFFAFPYVYPPLWAVLAAPLTGLMGVKSFCNAVLLLQVPMLAASVPLAGRLMRPAAMPRALWLLIGLAILSLSLQSQLALWQNQPTITVVFLVLLAFVCLDADRPIAAGAVLALAAAIKLTPAAFAVIFLLDRQYRALAAFLITGGALALLSIALAGIDLHWAFLASTRAIGGQALLNATNISVLPALLALGSVLGLSPPVDTADSVVIIRSIPAALGPAITLCGALLAAAFLIALRRHPGPLRRGLALFALSVIIPLFGPLGWLHYYLLPLFLLPGVLAWLPRRTAILCGLAIALLSFRATLPHIAWLPWPVANYLWLSVMTWLALLGATFLCLRRHR